MVMTVRVVTAAVVVTVVVAATATVVVVHPVVDAPATVLPVKHNRKEPTCTAGD